MDAEATSINSALQIPAVVDVSALSESLQPHFRVITKPPVHETFSFLDTFEWSLWFDGKVLYHSGNQTVCASLVLGWPETILAQESAEQPPSPLPRDWAPGPLRSMLKKRVGLRALVPVADISSKSRTLELSNADDKVVLRLELVHFYEPGKTRTPFFSFCRPKPLRGYAAEATDALAQLRRLGLSPVSAGPLDQFFSTRGCTPEPYTLRPVFGLNSDEPAREAVRDIVRRMLTIARSQEDGIINDMDTEYLHDYRICLRKIRSIISLTKGVYPRADTQRLKTQWARLAQPTNRLRDFDVYLLDREAYTNLLPRNLQHGLQSFFEEIQRERTQAHRNLSKHLRSKTYLKKVETLASFFSEPDQLPESEHSGDAIKARASDRIYRRYKRIRKASGAIKESTPDAAIHEIRIECKKLRYMLEFFGELYDADKLNALLKNLRKLQNCLGRFNDYAVQQDSLLAYCEEHKQAMTADQALSIGGLVAVLNQEQRKQRVRAEKALGRFGRPSIHRLFRSVFKPQSADDT